jgi:hypothetical protein
VTRLQSPAGRYSPGQLENRRRVRKSIADQLRSEAEQFSKGQVRADIAARNVLIFTGRYRALRDRLTRRLFNVYEIKHAEKKKRTEDDLVVDLDIRLVGGLAPPDDKPSPEKEEFFVQLNKTITVINTVCQRMEDRASKSNDAAETARILRLRDEYTGKLVGLAKIGLENPYTPLAKLGLSELKNEFVAQEAGRIKNTYVRWLGLWAGLAALLFVVAYVLVVSEWPHWKWWQGYKPWWLLHKSFLLAAAGAAIGTWISFSVRQVQLSFDDLLMLEEDSLDPPMRVIFVIALTLTACLLFWTGTINLEVGGLKTNPQEFKQAGSGALLIGLFAGLSERALATAISGRAAAFVQGIAGGR